VSLEESSRDDVQEVRLDTELAPRAEVRSARNHVRPSDPEWFDRVYRMAYGPALVYARRLVGFADADDIVQEAFLRLAKYKQYNGETIGINFVLAMTRNVAYTALNTRVKERERQHAHSNAREHIHIGKSRSDSSIAFEDRHLKGLTDSQREALILVQVKGLSETQASLVMHISRPVVSAKMRSAVKTLRALAREEDEIEFAGSPASIPAGSRA